MTLVTEGRAVHFTDEGGDFQEGQGPLLVLTLMCVAGHDGELLMLHIPTLVLCLPL